MKNLLYLPCNRDTHPPLCPSSPGGGQEEGQGQEEMKALFDCFVRRMFERKSADSFRKLESRAVYYFRSLFPLLEVFFFLHIGLFSFYVGLFA